MLLYCISLLLLICNLACCQGNSAEDKNADPAKNLRSVGYFGHAESSPGDAGKTGLIKYLPQASYQGLTLIYNHIEPPNYIYLIKNSGEIFHQWCIPEELRFRIYIAKANQDGSLDLILENNDHGFIRLNQNSDLIISVPGHFHHDFLSSTSGDYFLFEEHTNQLHYNNRDYVILDNSIYKISSTNYKASAMLSLNEALKDDKYYQRYLKLVTESGITGNLDIFHVNSIIELPFDVKPLGERGDILICIRNLHMLVVLDRQTLKIKWKKSFLNVFERPHNPSIMSDGKILIFDNGYFRKWSQVAAYDPVQDSVINLYGSPDRKDFYSRLRGAAQLLPNNNILITESDKGRVFEINPERQIVWDWFNPYIKNAANASKKPDKRPVLYRAYRYDNNFFSSLNANYGQIKCNINLPLMKRPPKLEICKNISGCDEIN